MNDRYNTNEQEYKIEIGDMALTVIVHDIRSVSFDTTKFFTPLDWHKQVHTHLTYEIFWVGDGDMSVVTENENLKCRNSVIVFPPGCRHYTMNGGGRLGTVVFQLERIPTVTSDTPQIFDSIVEALSDKPFITDILPDEIFYVTKIFDSKRVGICPESDTYHLVCLLFSNLFGRMVTEPKEDKHDKYKIYVNTIEDYIHDKYTERIRITDIAKLLYISPKQVSRIIERAYGCSLSELVNKHRVTVACMLLTRTDMKIEEISASVGYEYPHRLFQNFKKTYGVTPAKYRKARE